MLPLIPTKPPNHFKGSMPALPALILSIALFAFFVIAGPGLLNTLNWQGDAILVLAVSGLLGVCIVRSFSSGVWSLPFLTYLVIAFFHIGLYISVAVTGQATVFDGGIWTDWINEQNMGEAAFPLMIGLLSYTTLAVLSVVLSPREKEPLASPSSAISLLKRLEREAIADVGGVLVCLGVLVWLYLSVASAGPLFMLGTYESYLIATRNYPMGLLYLAISIGAVFVAQAPRRRMGVLAIFAFAFFSAAGFVVGLRGETLMPLVGALAVYGRHTKMPRARVFVVASIAVLVAIAAVAQIRAAGLLNSSNLNVSATPLKAIEEMGFSIRPLVVSIDWHEHAQEPYKFGATYWAPFERGIASVAGASEPPADEDYRLMNVEIADRVGQIGGSIIAEAHHNFGNLGVASVMGLAGLSVGLMARRSGGPRGEALLGIFAILLLMHVRNSFAPLPAWGGFGVAVLFLSLLIARGRQERAR